MRFSDLVFALGAASAVAADDGSSRVHRRPDEFWDHIIKGADVAKATGHATRDEQTSIANFNLRAKAVDPSSLGVDTVKQYSGYLDNDAEDKHLFYCTCLFAIRKTIRLGEHS